MVCAAVSDFGVFDAGIYLLVVGDSISESFRCFGEIMFGYSNWFYCPIFSDVNKITIPKELFAKLDFFAYLVFSYISHRYLSSFCSTVSLCWFADFYG